MLRRCAPVFAFTLSLGASSLALADDVPPEKPKKEKKGNCSVESVESSEANIAGLAALALLISAASLRRQRP